MKLWIIAVLVAAATDISCGDENVEPMVAFVCDKPAMYSKDHGRFWIKDDSTGCLKDPVDILNYCRKIFPTLDVRNVVESSEKVAVSNWCDFGESLCSVEFTVTPFRCLVGAFQSDALLVPEHCVFDHIHDSKLCTSFNEWNLTAVRSCTDRGMVQHSCAMLQPCGIDRFNGVEFVCCPNKQDTKKDMERDIVVTSGKQNQQQTQTVAAGPAPGLAVKVRQNNATAASSRYQSGKPPQQTNLHHPQQQQQQQQQRQKGHKWNEHEYYMKAKNDMQKHHHDKITEMMKDWAAARQRVQEMRARDPKASEKLNKEITSRFQKMYEAEEVESEMERKQLSLLHQQRVQAEISEKKDSARDAFIDILDDYNADAGEILKSMKRYIKTLHKDRMHTINRYQHLEDVDPKEAANARQDTAEHLRRVDQQLTDAIRMLNRVPRFRNKIMQQIQDFLDAYHSMDRDAASILLTHTSKKEPKKQEVAEDDEGYNDEYEDDEDDDIDDEDDDDNDEDDEKNVKVDKKVNSKEKETDSPKPSKESKVTKEVNKKDKSDDADNEEDDDDDDDDDESDDDSDDDNDEDDEDDSFGDDLDEPVFEMPAKIKITVAPATETTRQPTTKSAAPVQVKSGFGESSEESKEADKEEKKVEEKDNKEEVKEKKEDVKEKKEEKDEEGKMSLVDVDYYHLKGADAPANVERDILSINQGYIRKTPLHTDAGNMNAAVPLGLAVAGLTVFIVIVVGVILMRRRQTHMRPPRPLGSFDLDPAVESGAISPEERHVASMQMNGYENPTYKYFEQQSNA